ncbi:hypothetical protein WMY93_009891 [Mugilogobius chulae]|uniref:MADF domain-containing protein n=1 Tax=Mugilogobius chulae TaxID=88201 RepID=A0AAW0P5I3_9GOBI
MATRTDTEIMEARLVELWQFHACLYDVSSSTYHDRYARLKSLEEIANELHLTVNEVKVKLASLRTQYGKLIRPKASGSGHKPLSSKQQWIVRHLEFLKTHVTHRSPQTTLRTDTVPDEDTTDSLEEDQMGELSTIDQEQLADICPTSSPDTVETGSSIRPNVKKSKKTTPEENIETAKLELLKQVQSTLSASANADSDDIFGQQVAVELRNIKDKTLKLRVKRKIMNMLYDMQEEEQGSL